MWKWLQSNLRAGVPAARAGEPFAGIREVSQPPETLKNAVRSRECVLFAGEELSRACAMPVWPLFLVGFADWLISARRIEPELADQLREWHRAGQHSSLLAALKSRTAGQPDLVLQYARELYLKPAALSRTHEALASVPFRAAITANLDTLIERIYRLEPEHVLTTGDAMEATRRLAAGEPFLLKLRGAFDRATTTRVWLDEALAQAAADQELAGFFSHLLDTRTLLSVGATLTELERWLGAAKLKTPPQRVHYALIPATEGSTLAQAKEMHKRYNLHALEYTPRDTRAAVAFLQSLTGEAEVVTLMED